MAPYQRMNFRYYAVTLTRMLGEPRRFYREIWLRNDLKRPLIFLLISALFNGAAGLVRSIPPQPLQTFGILFLNGMGMACLGAVILYSGSAMLFGRKASFSELFSIVALSSGVTLLASWIPFFIWLTEPWKWWLIAVGMVHGCGFRWWQVLLVCGMTVLILFFLFWTLLPAVIH